MVEAANVNFVVKAAELRGKADALLKGGFFSNLLTSKQDRLDDAK
jgi:tetratricopeptide (TPR) repeat protein